MFQGQFKLKFNNSEIRRFAAAGIFLCKGSSVANLAKRSICGSLCKTNHFLARWRRGSHYWSVRVYRERDWDRCLAPVGTPVVHGGRGGGVVAHRGRVASQHTCNPATTAAVGEQGNNVFHIFPGVVDCSPRYLFKLIFKNCTKIDGNRTPTIGEKFILPPKIAYFYKLRLCCSIIYLKWKTHNIFEVFGLNYFFIIYRE